LCHNIQGLQSLETREAAELDVFAQFHGLDSLPPSAFSSWIRIVKLSALSNAIGGGMAVQLYAAYEYPLVLHHWSLVLSDYLTSLRRLDISSESVERTSTSIRAVNYLLPMTAALQRLWGLILSRNLISPGASGVRQRSRSMFTLRMRAFANVTPMVDYDSAKDTVFPAEASLETEAVNNDIERYLKAAESAIGRAVSPNAFQNTSSIIDHC
jgi:hypothetical protein